MYRGCSPGGPLALGPTYSFRLVGSQSCDGFVHPQKVLSACYYTFGWFSCAQPLLPWHLRGSSGADCSPRVVIKCLDPWVGRGVGGVYRFCPRNMPLDNNWSCLPLEEAFYAWGLVGCDEVIQLKRSATWAASWSKNFNRFWRMYGCERRDLNNINRKREMYGCSFCNLVIKMVMIKDAHESLTIRIDLNPVDCTDFSKF